MSCLVGYKARTGWDGSERFDWWRRGGDSHEGRDRARHFDLISSWFQTLANVCILGYIQLL